MLAHSFMRVSNMTEWLGALGLAWPRLLIYPGGVFALLFAWLLDRSLGRQAASSTPHGHPYPILIDISAVVLPLILISLLPLPLSGFFGYTPDLITALVLIEWPLCLVGSRGQTHEGALSGISRDFWHAYLRLILSILVLVQINGSFRLDTLTNTIDPLDMATYLVWLVGMLGWWAALVPLVGRDWPGVEAQGFVRHGMHLRAAGHVLLACLPIMGLIQGNLWLAMICLAGLVAGLAGATRYHRRLPVRQICFWRTGILVALVLVLGWETYMALVSQLM